MVCPKCNTSNPGGAKFCEKCGTKLAGGASGAGVKIPRITIPGIPTKLILPLIGLILLVVVGFFGYQRFTNTPQAVIGKYFKALGKNDLTTALALVVPEERLAAKASLDSLLSGIERLDIKQVKVTNVVISDDEASADVKLDFEMKLKSGQKFTYLASKETLVIFDGKTKIEVPISEINKYSEAQPLFRSVELEKVKGKWYISNQ